MKNYDIKTCKICKAKYSFKELERSLGTFSWVLFSGCCSAGCYTKTTRGKK